MSILVNKNTRVLTQGITGATGRFHTKACKEYGTLMVAGVTPGKGGSSFEEIPIFDTVERAVKETRDNASVTVSEGATASNTGTWSDPGDDVVFGQRGPLLQGEELAGRPGKRAHRRCSLPVMLHEFS